MSNSPEYMKAYAEQNRERIAEYKRIWHQQNKASMNARARAYHAAHSVEFNAKSREYYRAHKEEFSIRAKAYKESHKDELAVKAKEYVRFRRNTDIQYRLKLNARRRLSHALHGAACSLRTTQILGCNMCELKTHLEGQFTDGMSWGNYGEWEVDHILPCASFDLTREEELLKCFNFTNLQPLWKSENRRKSSKVEWQAAA